MSRYVQLPLDHFDDDRRIGCEDPEAIAAEIVLMVATKRLESDGLLSRLQARKALAGCAFVADPADAVQKLVAANLAVERDDGSLELPGWERWMKSKAELDAYREQQRAHGRRGGRPKTKGDPSGDEKGDPSGNGRGEPLAMERVGGSHPTQPNLTEPEPNPTEVSVASVIQAYVAHRLAQGGLENPGAFARAVLRDNGEWISRYIDEHPSASVAKVGDALHGERSQSAGR